MTDEPSKTNKRLIEVISVADASNRDLDFTNPNSSDQLQIADIELIFENGTLYANAAVLITTCDFFRGMLLESWQSTSRNEMHRCVYPMADPKLGVSKAHQVILPVLYLAYGKRAETLRAIEDLFLTPPLLDDFLNFANKIGWTALINSIHQALVERVDNYTEIYPVLKKHSNYGQLPGLLSGGPKTPVNSLEVSFFATWFTPGALSPKKNAKRRPHIEMFEAVTDEEDVRFFYNTYCGDKRNEDFHLQSLRYLLLLNKPALIANLEKLDLSIWSVAEWCSITQWSNTCTTPALMSLILKHLCKVTGKQPGK